MVLVTGNVPSRSDARERVDSAEAVIGTVVGVAGSLPDIYVDDNMYIV